MSELNNSDRCYNALSACNMSLALVVSLAAIESALARCRMTRRQPAHRCNDARYLVNP